MGIVQGIQGIVNLATAFPCSVIGDKRKRQDVLRIAGVVGFVAIALTLYTLLWVEINLRDKLFYILCGTMAVWGVWMGAHGATVEALFGDSVESGARSKLYAQRGESGWGLTVSNVPPLTRRLPDAPAAWRTCGDAVGPFVSIFVFAFFVTDEWTVLNLTIVRGERKTQPHQRSRNPDL